MTGCWRYQQVKAAWCIVSNEVGLGTCRRIPSIVYRCVGAPIGNCTAADRVLLMVAARR
jgi:hypothetical protein